MGNNIGRLVPGFQSPYYVNLLAGGASGGFSDGTGANAQFASMVASATDSAGNVYVTDQGNETIDRIDPQGHVSTVAGTGQAGYVDGPGSTAQFNGLNGICLDSLGNIYVADSNNGVVRKIDTSNNVTTFAGGFGFPIGLAVDPSNNIYVTSWQGAPLSAVTPSGSVSPIPAAISGAPIGVAIDSTGDVLVGLGSSILKVDSSLNVTTLAGGPSTGFVDGTSSTALFSNYLWVAADPGGNVIVGDVWNNAVRKIDTNGNVVTVAGNGRQGIIEGPGGMDGIAEFDVPQGVSLDAQGNILVVDRISVRKITLGGNSPCPSPTSPCGGGCANIDTDPPIAAGAASPAPQETSARAEPARAQAHRPRRRAVRPRPLPRSPHRPRRVGRGPPRTPPPPVVRRLEMLRRPRTRPEPGRLRHHERWWVWSCAAGRLLQLHGLRRLPKCRPALCQRSDVGMEWDALESGLSKRHATRPRRGADGL